MGLYCDYFFFDKKTCMCLLYKHTIMNKEDSLFNVNSLYKCVRSMKSLKCYYY